ncbi:NAD(P)-binding protein [Calocera viscosa TUFC12733]|uniref:NAD(P)-binding protein n=1 Tax=Calocera viscosa (strain TUFC12733) TaxID=1330018 RepID=A0A167PZU3_CALVF|nr:NAD(P)-binding protein [Calocera viscosa TUFC12733]
MLDSIRFNVQRLHSLYSSIFPPRAKWGFGDIPDLTGRVAIVTGGNAGIGKVMCRELLAHGARVYMFCRTPSKAQGAISELQGATGKSAIQAISCDLSSLPSVLSAAREFLKQEKELHLLFCSAGLSMLPVEQVTEQGYDMTFGVNLLAHAYLVKLLLPTMKETAKTAAEGSVRVVTTASSSHRANNGAPSGGIDYLTLKPSPERTARYAANLAYHQSKWANIVYTLALTSHLPPSQTKVLFVSVDPGWIRTGIWAWQAGLGKAVTGMLLSDVEHGALTPLYAGVAQGVKRGGFYVPWAREGRSRMDTGDKELQEKLWDWVERELEGQPGL